jgi:triacylglycerol lipase
MPAPIDPAMAYTYGTVVEAAYRLFTPGLLDPATAAAQLPPGWTVLTELTAIDRVHDKSEPEFFGLALQSPDQGLLIAIRGTDLFIEWLVDAEFMPRSFPGAANSGKVEDGFCSVYSSLRCTSTGSDVRSLVSQLPAPARVTIAGHSLGAAVATLLALDVAVNVPGVDLTLYTYASPRVGDAAFVALCNTRLPVHYRIVNRPDLVPRLPPLYEATGTEIELDSTTYPVVAHKVACYHTLTTYLWLLNQASRFGLGTCARPDGGS